MSRFAVLATGLLLLVTGCSEKAAQPPAGGGGRRGGGAGGPAPVVVAKAHPKIVPLTLEAIGAVEPSRTASVRSQVTGTLLKIHFQEGQEVKQGDLLFQIDPRPFENAVKSAEADLQKFRVQLETARTQVARYKTLSKDAMVSQEQFQTIQDSERVLTAQALVSESSLANARLQLEYCSIRAPLPGRTGAVGAHEGDLIRASDTSPLVTVHQLSPILVTFGVPQQYLTPLARYRAAGEIAVNATPPGTGTDTGPEKGQLIFVDNAVDSSSGTIKLKASFPNDAHRLWPGQFANISILLASPEVLVVPASAVENDQSGQHVFVVKADNTAEFRKITVERITHEDAVITSGLTAGETVVADGQLRVIAGKPVEIKSSDEGPVAPARGRGDGSGRKKGKDGKEKEKGKTT
ncbi:MAG: efflux RND transporter periplasmic adaptor subunit [Opitutaceae bacterium]